MIGHLKSAGKSGKPSSSLTHLLLYSGIYYLLIAIDSSFGEETHDREWGLAVATNDKIVLLNKNATVVNTLPERFDRLKALAFDNVAGDLIVSDTNQENDTIYSLGTSATSDKTYIANDVADNILGLAVDSETHTLYWSDTTNKIIYRIALDDATATASVFLQFNDTHPEGLAIDTCRRYIYWIDSHETSPSIGRASLLTGATQILVDTDIRMPMGITLDPIERRIYWTDLLEGIYYRIESVDFDGDDRRVIDGGTHGKPYAIAVDEENVYWTDVANNAVWYKSKTDDDDGAAKKLYELDDKPGGLFARNAGSYNGSNCDKLVYNDAPRRKAKANNAKKKSAATNDRDDDDEGCLNDGERATPGGECKCRPFYGGRRCEIFAYAFYCLHGAFVPDPVRPRCACDAGFGGDRCEIDLCRDRCVNGGVCHVSRVVDDRQTTATCECPRGFDGEKCEVARADTAIDVKEEEAVVDEDDVEIVESSSSSSGELKARSKAHLNTIEIYYIFVAAIVLLLLTNTITLIFLKKRSLSRTKKRIIVNKNVKPLGFRPRQPSNNDRCEITIECCNMNICETPCFEPAKFKRAKKEEKKVLLSNVDGEENH